MGTDSYIPFYGAEFMSAVRGYPAHVKWSYLCAIWQYWLDHCVGLRADEAFLKRVCESESEEQWLETKAALFERNSGFFDFEGGRWHQRRARSEWLKRQEAHRKKVDAGKKRWQH